MKKKLLTSLSIIASFIISVLISLTVSALVLQKNAKDRKDKAFIEAKNVSSNLNRDIQDYVHLLNLFSYSIIENSGNYDAILANMRVFFHNSSALKNVILRPKSGNPIYYPYFENDIFDFESDDIKSLFDSSRKYGSLQMAVKTDFSRRQCSEILLINPVYVEGKRGISEFWGYVCCILNGDDIFGSSYLLDLYASGYEFAIVFMNKINGANKVIYSTPKGMTFAPTGDREVVAPGAVDFDLESFHMNISDSFISNMISYDEFSLSLYISAKGDWTSVADRISIFFFYFIICILIVFVVDMIFYLTQKESKLIEYSYIDGLTGLLNARRYFEYLRDLQDDKKKFCIFYIDLNDFKPVNDNYGHLIGNEVLSIIGRRLRNCVKQADSSFRIGGDEFSVVVEPFEDENDYKILASRLSEAIEKEIVLENHRIKVGASIGYSTISGDEGYENVITKAEEMMYAEKKRYKKER